jgi:hypothetical protein
VIVDELDVQFGILLPISWLGQIDEHHATHRIMKRTLDLSLLEARAYYMHSVFHDWPEDKCREILRCIIPSIKKGSSKILIDENVIPDRNAHWLITSLDIVISICASGERTESIWRQHLESVSLKVVGIWTYRRGTESLIEAELAYIP